MKIRSLIGRIKHIFYGWWIVIASFVIAVFVGGTAFYGFTAFFNPIVKEMGWSHTETSLAFSLRSVEGGLVRPVVGFIIDRVGTRKCVFFGMLIIGTAMILMSRVQSLIAFYASFLLLSLGLSAALGIASVTAVANWFRRRRGMALGILSAGFGVSGGMTPIIVYLINTYNWRNTLAIIGVAALVIGLPLSLVIKHRPQDYGYLPDGEVAGNSEQSANSGNVTAKKTGLQHSNPPSPGGLSVSMTLRTTAFWLLCAFSFFTSFSHSAITVHEMPFLISVGITENIAGLTMFGITASSLIGRVGFAWLGDKYSKKRLVIIAAMMQMVGVFIFANIKTPLMIIPFLLFYGPGFGAPIPLMAAMQADYFGTARFASIRGLITLGFSVSGLIAPLFAGWIFDVQGNYYTAFIIFAILCGCAVPFILAIKPPELSQQLPH
jgi:sugar phosphate permease